ncbi:hypothetical protein GJAV_G00126270 [Gymnothorax javanicus]|nr:hypothetical protein GJAV_G00126270 [Gymnothorax javanicus]
MRLLILSSVCLLLAATAVAQRPHPCRSPPFLTGSLSFIYPKGQLFVYEKFTYEALGRRIRSRLHGTYQNHPFHEDVLLLFREGVIYQISYANRTCTKRPLKMAFQPIEIPRNATLQAQVIVGSSSGPGQGLLVNNWTGDIPEEEAKYFLTFTELGAYRSRACTTQTRRAGFLRASSTFWLGLRILRTSYRPVSATRPRQWTRERSL